VKIFPKSLTLRAPILALLAAGIVFVVYLRTMAPTIFLRDSASIAAAAASFGLVHPPGYSVYLLVAHLFAYLPVGDIAYRVNLLSGVATGGTVALLVLLLKDMTGRKLPAFVAALSFAFNFYVWSVSVVAEVYTLQGFFLIILLLALWQWQQHGSQNALLIFSIFIGLAIVNNPATSFWWPGLLILAWMTPHRQELTWRVLFKMAMLFLLGLTPILYLPIRSQVGMGFHHIGTFDEMAVFHQLDLTQADNLWGYFSVRAYRSWAWEYSGWAFVTESIRFIYRLWAAFLSVGFPLGLWGIWKLWQRHSLWAWGLLLTALPHTIFFIAYGAIDKETMFLPVYLIWAIFLAFGLNDLIEILPQPMAFMQLLLPLGLLLLNMPLSDMSHDYITYERAEIRLQHAQSKAIYLASWGEASAMEYLQITTGMRPDVTVINTLIISRADRVAITQNALRRRRSVYVEFFDPILLKYYNLIEVKSGYQIHEFQKQLSAHWHEGYLAK